MTASKWRNEAFELGKSIQVTANLSPEIYVLGSENAIIDAVANLIINAVDAIEHAGEIEISVRAAGDDAILQVSDNGVGMYEATRSRIFEPFYTTKESGHGLGLSIIEEAFRAMAGGIVVESAPGEGSTFTATFPRAEKAGRTAEMQEGRGATPRKSLAVYAFWSLMMRSPCATLRSATWNCMVAGLRPRGPAKKRSRTSSAVHTIS